MEKQSFSELYRKAQDIQTEIKKVVLGKDEIIRKILATALAGGHVLLDDIPGVGKTTLALAFSSATSMLCHRLQFTPDVLPTDVTGFNVYDKKTDRFVYKPGAALCNLFLADEINRTSSKTQSALLEIMEEGAVTVDSVTRPLPQPFTVIATQNPIGSVGTQMLPDSQLDRFMVCLNMGYPKLMDEVSILRDRQTENPLDLVEQKASKEDIMEMREVVKNIHTDQRILEYIATISDRTRNNEMFRLGLSPRGSLALIRLARANAFLDGRNYVTPDDIADCFLDVAAHRVILSPKAKATGGSKEQILTQLLKEIPTPGFERR